MLYYNGNNLCYDEFNFYPLYLSPHDLPTSQSMENGGTIWPKQGTLEDMLNERKIIMRMVFVKTFVYFLMSFVFIVVLGCHKDTEQDKVKKILVSVQTAAEEKDVRKITNSLSKTYKDPQGYDYETIKGMLLGYFFQHQKIHVYLANVQITVQEGIAKAVFQAVLSGGNKTEPVRDILPEELGMNAFEVSLKKEPDEWKVTSAKWERVGTGEGGGGR